MLDCASLQTRGTLQFPGVAGRCDPLCTMAHWSLGTHPDAIVGVRPGINSLPEPRALESHYPGGSGGLLGMIAGTILGEALAMALNRHFALQLLSGLRLSWGFPDRDLLREMRTFGLHALVWNTASFITMYSDSIIVSRIFGPTAASRYYATTAPAQWGSNAIMRLMATAVPGVNQLLALNEGIALRATYARLIRYSCGLAVALSSCLLVINRDV